MSIKIDDDDIRSMMEELLKKQIVYFGENSKFIDTLILISPYKYMGAPEKDSAGEKYLIKYNSFIDFIDPVLKEKHIPINNKDEFDNENINLFLEIFPSPKRIGLGELMSTFDFNDPTEKNLRSPKIDVDGDISRFFIYYEDIINSKRGFDFVKNLMMNNIKTSSILGKFRNPITYESAKHVEEVIRYNKTHR